MGRKKSKNNKRYRSFKRCKVLFEASPEFFPDVLPKPVKAYAVTEENESAFLKYMGLWGARKKTPKTLYYKGHYASKVVECEVIGFSHFKGQRSMLVVEFEDDWIEKQVLVFAPYFLDMQNEDFEPNIFTRRSEYGVDD